MEQIEQAVMYALGPQVDPNLKAQVKTRTEKSLMLCILIIYI